MKRRRSRAASKTAAVVGGVDRPHGLAFDLRPIAPLKKRGRISDDQLPALGLAQRGIQNPVDMVHRSRGEAALAIAALPLSSSLA